MWTPEDFDRFVERCQALWPSSRKVTPQSLGVQAKQYLYKYPADSVLECCDRYKAHNPDDPAPCWSVIYRQLRERFEKQEKQFSGSSMESEIEKAGVATAVERLEQLPAEKLAEAWHKYCRDHSWPESLERLQIWRPFAAMLEHYVETEGDTKSQPDSIDPKSIAEGWLVR